MASKITLCSTPASLRLAVSALSTQSVILVNCEAQDLGFPGCVLSIISLSDPLAEHVFLVDVLAFPSSPTHCASSAAPPPVRRPHPALAPLLALLSLPHITKVFFDGRAGVLELLLAYGLVLANVLDLQLVEAAARAQKSKLSLSRIEPHLLKHSFKTIAAEVERNPSAYAGIYAVRCLEHVVGFFKLASTANLKRKDPAFVAMRRACGSAIWLARPLPEPLQTSATYHITLIALVYAHFMDWEWVGEHMRALRAQSAVYLGMLSSREENARLKELKLLRFLPLGIIDRDVDVDESAPRYGCGCCLRDLTVDCYTTRLQSGNMSLEGDARGVRDAVQAQERERLSYCRLCNAVAQKDGRTIGEWVAS